MRTLAVANQKGGSGKTTTAVCLSAALAELGRRVLLVDLDPQASASVWLGVKQGGAGMYNLFTDNGQITEMIRPTNDAGVKLIPSSSWLAGVEKALASEVGAETVLARKLRTLSERDWDYVLFDCPPTLGILAVNALAAAREVLVPVEAHVLSLYGVVNILELVDIVKERLNPTLEICGILACRVDARTRHAQEIVERLRERFGTLVYQSVVRENIRLAECPSFGKPITQYADRSSGARDYRLVAGEVIGQEGSV